MGMLVGTAAGADLKNKMESFGNLNYKTCRDISAVAGEPVDAIPQDYGMTLKVWEATGYKIGLLFDDNDVCLGVSFEESNITVNGSKQKGSNVKKQSAPANVQTEAPQESESADVQPAGFSDEEKQRAREMVAAMKKAPTPTVNPSNEYKSAVIRDRDTKQDWLPIEDDKSGKSDSRLAQEAVARMKGISLDELREQNNQKVKKGNEIDSARAAVAAMKQSGAKPFEKPMPKMSSEPIPMPKMPSAPTLIPTATAAPKPQPIPTPPVVPLPKPQAASPVAPVPKPQVASPVAPAPQPAKADVKAATSQPVASPAKSAREAVAMLKENSQPKAEPVFSPADELIKYKQLLDMGGITEEEYSRIKKKILGF